MQRRIPLLALLSMSLAALAADPLNTDSLKSSLTSAASGSLTSLLTSKLGITQNQAEGGVGSVLKLAQEKLAAGDFDQVAAAVPGAQKYLDKARSLGAYSGSVGNAAGLNAALGKLGIPPATAAKFAPLVTNFVGKAGGSKTGALLKTVLSG